jgi:hypothetical protein
MMPISKLDEKYSLFELRRAQKLTRWEFRFAKPIQVGGVAMLQPFVDLNRLQTMKTNYLIENR